LQNDSTHYLNIRSDDYFHSMIVLGTSFLTNHCVSKNIATGEWAFANTVTDTEMAIDPTFDSTPITAATTTTTTTTTATPASGTSTVGPLLLVIISALVSALWLQAPSD
jgi:hypothetical protein